MQASGAGGVWSADFNSDGKIDIIFALGYTQNLVTELEDAVSRITDLDVAQETAKSVSLQIIRDSVVAVFTPANQIAKIVFKLLQQKSSSA